MLSLGTGLVINISEVFKEMFKQFQIMTAKVMYREKRWQIFRESTSGLNDVNVVRTKQRTSLSENTTVAEGNMGIMREIIKN